MKRAVLVIFTIMTIIGASAQTGLHINRLFDGRYKSDSHATETIIKGSQLKSYQLSQYHALSITDNASAADDIEPLVIKDGTYAVSKEVSYTNGHLYYGFYRLRDYDDNHRYLFYLNQTLKGGNKIIVMFMEGTASPNKIKQMLKNSK